MKNIKHIVLKWWFPYLLAILWGWLGFVFATTEHWKKGIWSEAIAFFFLLLGTCIFLKKCHKESKYLLTMFFIYTIVTIFWDLSALSPYSNKAFPIIIIIGGIILNLSTIAIGIYAFCQFKDKIFYFWSNYKFIILVVLLFIIGSLEVLDDWPRCDSWSYFRTAQEAKYWDFSFGTVYLFKLAEHRAYGVALFDLIGAYLTPDSPLGIRMIQIAVVSFSAFLLSKIINYNNLDRNSKFLNTLIVSLILFNPLVFGLIFEINLDIYVFCFFIWLYYSYITNNKLLFLFSSFLLVFSKETAIPLWGAFIFGILALNFILKRNTMICIDKGIAHSADKEVPSFQLKTLFIICLIIMGSLALSFLFGGSVWLDRVGSMDISTDGTGINKFGWNTINIINKLKQLFGINFNWLYTLIILLIGPYSIWKNLIKPPQNKMGISVKTSSLPFILAQVEFILFNLLYITYNNPRYLITYLLGLILLFTFLLVNLNIGIRKKCIILSTLLLLSIIQNFTTIDPITYKLFKNIDTGNGKMITTRVFGVDENGDLTTDEDIWSLREMTHAASYNRQYTYFGEAFEKFLQIVDYKETDLIVVQPIYGVHMTYLSLFGKGDTYNDSYYYDPKSGNIVQRADYTKLNLLVTDDVSMINFSEFDRIYYVSMDFNKKYESQFDFSSVDIEDTFDVTYRNWKLHINKIVYSEKS